MISWPSRLSTKRMNSRARGIRRGLLRLDIFHEISVPLVRPMEERALNGNRKSRRAVAERLDLLARKLALQTELVPAPDVGVAAACIFRRVQPVVVHQFP